MSDPAILVDLTPLDTPSRVRGIGRYVRELAVGLSRLHPDETRGLRLLGLTSLGWTGAARVTEDLSSFEGDPAIPRPRSSDHYRVAYAKRVGLARAARALGAKAVHLADPNATPLAWPWAGARRVVTCHDLIAFHFPERYFSWRDGGVALGRALERRRYATADLVVAISDATAKDLVRFLGVPAQHIVRVYNAVDAARWAALADGPRDAALAKHGLADGRYLLYVGDADFRKNAEGMMAGVARARARGVDVTLAWAASLSEERAAEVDRLARDAGVGAAFRRLGFVPDDELAKLYRGALAHLFVSRAEGFGLTVVEAMAAGCPVVTTREGSLAEVAGDAALTADPDDHAAIALAIERLAGDAATRGELAARGRERAKLFSHERQAREMVAVYRRALSGKVEP